MILLSGSVKLRCSVSSGLLRIARLGFATTVLFARALLFFCAFGQFLFCFFALALGLLFCCLLKRQLGLSDLLQATLASRQLFGQLVAAQILAVLRVLSGIGPFRGGHQGFD